MLIEIDDERIRKSHITEIELRKEIALLLYDKWVWGTREARLFSGMSRLEWLQFSGSRQSPIHYTIEDLENDIRTMRRVDAGGSVNNTTEDQASE